LLLRLLISLHLWLSLLLLFRQLLLLLPLLWLRLIALAVAVDHAPAA